MEFCKGRGKNLKLAKMEELNLMEIFKQRQLLHPSLETEGNSILIFMILMFGHSMMMAMKAMSWKS